LNAGVWTRDQAAASLLVNVGDMLSFAVWFGAAIWLSPIFIGMLHDWITRRRIHPVYTIGSIALFLSPSGYLSRAQRRG